MELTTHRSENTKSVAIPLEGKGGLFSGYDLSKFKVYNPKTLFPLDFDNIKNNKCPICGRKIYWRVDKKIGFCKSKVKDKFVITRKVWLSLGGIDK